MCVQVCCSAHINHPWDKTTRTITVPAGLGPDGTLAAVRDVLEQLDVPQPVCGAVCYCGDPVDIPSTLYIPAQRSEVNRVAS